GTRRTDPRARGMGGGREWRRSVRVDSYAEEDVGWQLGLRKKTSDQLDGMPERNDQLLLRERGGVRPVLQVGGELQRERERRVVRPPAERDRDAAARRHSDGETRTVGG